MRRGRAFVAVMAVAIGSAAVALVTPTTASLNSVITVDVGVSGRVPVDPAGPDPAGADPAGADPAGPGPNDATSSVTPEALLPAEGTPTPATTPGTGSGSDTVGADEPTVAPAPPDATVSPAEVAPSATGNAGDVDVSVDQPGAPAPTSDG
jgi:hypothetical protein